MAGNFVLPLLAVLILGCAAAQRPEAHATVRDEVEAVNRAMEAVVNGGRTEGAADFYTEDAIIRTARRVVASRRPAIAAYFAAVGRAKWKLDVTQVGGHRDAPYQVGKSTLIHGSKPDTSVVHFVVYWRRQTDGRLKIELDYYH